MLNSRLIFLRILIFVILLFSFISITAGENVKKSIDDNRDDTGEGNDESKDESLDIPVENEPNNLTCTRRQNSQMHEIRSAQHRQFPFMAAVLSHQHEYLCSGSVISNGLVLTTAKCTQQPISYILLNTTNDRREDSAMLHVIKIDKFPAFTGSESLKDVGLIYTEKYNSTIASKISLSNFTSSRNLVDVEAVGFGLNYETGQTRELQYIGLELRPAFQTRIAEDILRGYFDCVETKVSTCFKDTGGPIIYDNELIGIVIKGQEECTREMSSTYAINKQMAEIVPAYTFKAWLDEKIKKNEEQEESSIPTYPSKPVLVLRQSVHQMTSAGYFYSTSTFVFTAICSILAVF